MPDEGLDFEVAADLYNKEMLHRKTMGQVGKGSLRQQVQSRLKG